MNVQDQQNPQKKRYQASSETDRAMQATRDWMEAFNPQKWVGAGVEAGGSASVRHGQTDQIQEIWTAYLDTAANLMKKSAEVIQARNEDTIMLWEELHAGPPPAPSYDTPLSGVRRSMGAPVDGQPGGVSSSQAPERKP